MEIWFIIITTLCISALIKSLFNLILSPSSSSSYKNLPPGPATVPVIGNFLWLRKSLSEIEQILQDLRGKYGPIITLRIGHRPAIFVSSHSIAHHALIQNGAHFSDRPKALATNKIVSSNQHNISSAAYGPTWRLLRRNLTSEILHPSRVKSYTHARQWVLGILIHRLLNSAEDSSAKAVKVVDHFQYAMFCLLVLMCFGDRLDEKQITQIETVQRTMLLRSSRFNILNFWPKLGKIVFRNRWNELLRMRRDQEEVLIPLIEARVDVVKQRRQGNQEEEASVVAYVDTLVDLELPDEKRKLNNDEMVPKGTMVNFMVAEMGWDPKVWDEPMEFKPERFLTNSGGNGGEGEGEATVVFDVTGSKEIKMMPFGAGRRICPASGLALLHLEYFVANLVWYFEWTAADGNDGDVDLSEKQEFTIVMKNPLRAYISPRSK
ncbi:Cytochrome P450 89A2 [Camellia lanceoleosa]|uniref:Cytochrome P450 89A2 n=1 Tax=Camellia lanceoleosa TaxID=1840588 RepID=A0ACC0FLL5_9ERIC|nr:Cytochrome P450 89A2 [Camellia lanceoleosa]